MAICTYCGATIEDNVKFCTSCGAPVSAPEAPSATTPSASYPTANQASMPGQPSATQPYIPPTAPVVDSGSIGWGILGFFFPIVGLILFLVWKGKKPQSAKVAGIGAIIGFVAGIIMQFMMQ